MGGEQLMRGYYLGRYRDNNLVAGQVEYRFLPFPFSKRLGAAAFLGAGTVAPKVGDLRLSQLKVDCCLLVQKLLSLQNMFTDFR